VLTKEGKKKKEKSREVVLRFNEAIQELIEPEKLRIFFEVLQKINRSIEKNNIYEKISPLNEKKL
jgi:DNA-binding MarR family transcriptional regulator